MFLVVFVFLEVFQLYIFFARMFGFILSLCLWVFFNLFLLLLFCFSCAFSVSLAFVLYSRSVFSLAFTISFSCGFRFIFQLSLLYFPCAFSAHVVLGFLCLVSAMSSRALCISAFFFLDILYKGVYLYGLIVWYAPVYHISPINGEAVFMEV